MSSTAASQGTEVREAPSPLAPAKTPVGVGAIGLLGPVLALLAIAAGVVLVRDALVWAKLIQGRAWSQQVGAGLNGLTPNQWTLPVGVLAVVLGLILVVVALRRRPRTGIALEAATGVFLRSTDIARLARQRAEEVPGVLSARASANRRTVTVRVEGTAEPDGSLAAPELGAAVREAVTARLAALASAPTVKVTVEGARR